MCGTSSVYSTSSSMSNELDDDVMHSQESEGIVVVRKTSKGDRRKFFLLGFFMAFLLVMGVATSSLHVMCRGFSESCHITQEPYQHKRRIVSLFWKRSKQEERIDERSCFDPKQKPTRECVCRWIWDSVRERWNSLLIFHQGNEKLTTPVQDKATGTTVISRTTDPQRRRSKSEFPTAFTPEVIQLSTLEVRLIKELGQDTRNAILDLEERSKHVPWGGLRRNCNQQHTCWWAPVLPFTKAMTSLEKLDGGNLLYSYLRIMNWPDDLSVTHFPFKLCKKHACPAFFALNHTLTFREIYQPWLVTPSMETVNSKGLVYHQGFSPSLDGEHAPHAIVWLQPALAVSVDEMYYARTVIRELERAIAKSMEESKGRVGKFNVVVSCWGVSLGIMPSLKGMTTFVTILQDHYVDRLGVVLLTNMGKICEILLKLVLPLLTEEVRNKIIVVPHNDIERQRIFDTILGGDNVPEWLGGSSTYMFNAHDYYASDDVIRGTDLEAKEYLTLMPYHG
jgi:CRAL/TRIO domain